MDCILVFFKNSWRHWNSNASTLGHRRIRMVGYAGDQMGNRNWRRFQIDLRPLFSESSLALTEIFLHIALLILCLILQFRFYVPTYCFASGAIDLVQIFEIIIQHCSRIIVAVHPWIIWYIHLGPLIRRHIGTYHPPSLDEAPIRCDIRQIYHSECSCLRRIRRFFAHFALVRERDAKRPLVDPEVKLLASGLPSIYLGEDLA